MAYKFENASILIVDDMFPFVELTKSVLLAFGFKNVHTAPNGEEGFRMVCRLNPDLVLTDWIMEPVDGLELIRKIRHDPLSPNPCVPIIMMTGFSSRPRVEAARDNGMTEFLVKPFAARDLYKRVEQIIEKPRKFVKIGEFFGPDRRRKRGEGYAGPRRRDEDELKNEEPKTKDQKLAVDVMRKLQEEAKNV